MQSLAPPLSGTKAFARMEYKTSPASGAEYAVIFPAENMPTLGLLAGSIRVKLAQFALAGGDGGQSVAESSERFAPESAVGVASGGMVTGSVPPPLSGTFWIADTSTSTDAGAEPVVTVTQPWNAVGPGEVPVSAIRGIAPRFVPPGTPTVTVAL